MIGYDRLQGIFTVGLIQYWLWTDIQVVVVVFFSDINIFNAHFPQFTFRLHLLSSNSISKLNTLLKGIFNLVNKF